MIEPTITIIAGTVVGIITSIGYVVRRLSRDKLELDRNRAEGNLISDLIRQRDDARHDHDKVESELQRIGGDAAACLEKVKELLYKEQQLRIQNSLLSTLLERLADSLDTSKQELSEALRTVKTVAPL